MRAHRRKKARKNPTGLPSSFNIDDYWILLNDDQRQLASRIAVEWCVGKEWMELPSKFQPAIKATNASFSSRYTRWAKEVSGGDPEKVQGYTTAHALLSFPRKRKPSNDERERMLWLSLLSHLLLMCATGEKEEETLSIFPFDGRSRDYITRAEALAAPIIIPLAEQAWQDKTRTDQTSTMMNILLLRLPLQAARLMVEYASTAINYMRPIDVEVLDMSRSLVWLPAIDDIAYNNYAKNIVETSKIVWESPRGWLPPLERAAQKMPYAIASAILRTGIAGPRESARFQSYADTMVYGWDFADYCKQVGIKPWEIGEAIRSISPRLP